MTIIAVKDGWMAADSYSFVGSVGYPLAKGHSKITRSPDGSLVGSCGASVDCYALRLWVLDGMDFKKSPEFTYAADNEDSVYWFWLRKDGWLLAGDASMKVHPISMPAACGSSGACDMACGAMSFGATAEEAVRLVVERCNDVGGPVQIEKLDRPCPEPEFTPNTCP